MRHGYVRVAAVTPDVRVADVEFNVRQICEKIWEAAKEGAKIQVFPELCVTGYTCGDLFWQEKLVDAAREGMKAILEASRQADSLIFVGLPWEIRGKLYNVAAAVSRGKLLGIVPKRFLPNYAEFYEARYFTKGETEVSWIDFLGERVPFGMNLLFYCPEMETLTVAAEICEDLWAPNPPGTAHALAGATVLVNLSASDENAGKSIYRASMVANQSARLICGYVYASAGEGESTTDLVFGGHNMIAEDGTILAQARRFDNEIIYGEIDLHKIRTERRRMTTYEPGETERYERIPFNLEICEMPLTRKVTAAPFVPEDPAQRDARCGEILMIQAMGLKKRLQHTGCRTMILGISGGLDSTLALLVAAKTADLLGMEHSSILGVTMPCFGTTDRTYQNACELTRQIGAQLKEIPIGEAVQIHFRDIGQDPQKHDVTYENSQARERTQILMDLANQTGGLVIGTGDMSELALGWATYSGDHMSMYGVNASVPKTLVRHLVQYCARNCQQEGLEKVLTDILDTPVSPELLPPRDGEISQRTEDLVGPYELHDFFLFHILRRAETPSKVLRLAQLAFEGQYDRETILKWLKVFCRRFFSQQFKRSCMPDGPRVGSISLSPRGDWKMPSDASWQLWQEELERL